MNRQEYEERLAHGAIRGWIKNDRKYIDREYKNGHWNYTYADDNRGQHQVNQNRGDQLRDLVKGAGTAIKNQVSGRIDAYNANKSKEQREEYEKNTDNLYKLNQLRDKVARHTPLYDVAKSNNEKRQLENYQKQSQSMDPQADRWRTAELNKQRQESYAKNAAAGEAMAKAEAARENQKKIDADRNNEEARRQAYVNEQRAKRAQQESYRNMQSQSRDTQADRWATEANNRLQAKTRANNEAADYYNSSRTASNEYKKYDDARRSIDAADARERTEKQHEHTYNNNGAAGTVSKFNEMMKGINDSKEAGVLGKTRYEKQQASNYAKNAAAGQANDRSNADREMNKHPEIQKQQEETYKKNAAADRYNNAMEKASENKKYDSAKKSQMDSKKKEELRNRIKNTLNKARKLGR